MQSTSWSDDNDNPYTHGQNPLAMTTADGVKQKLEELSTVIARYDYGKPPLNKVVSFMDAVSKLQVNRRA